MKLNGYFKNFLLTTVNLNDDRIAKLNQRVDAVSTHLRNHDVFGEYFLDMIPQGSFAQRTIIKPVGTRQYDADILLVLKEHTTWTPAQYTSELKKALESSQFYRGKAHKRTRCVYIDYADPFHLDVIPYVEARGAITNNKINGWQNSNPEAFTSWLEGQNRITGGQLPKVIRLLKYLRDSKATFSIKSILLTILVGQRVESWRTAFDAKYYGDIATTLVHLLENLNTYLQSHPALPPIPDPAGTGQDFRDRWDQEGYANFRVQIKYYSEKARAAFDETDPELSLHKWQKVFGQAFQAPPSTVTKETSLVASGTPTEEFIDQKFRIPIRLSERVRLVGRVRQAGVQRAYDLPSRGDRVGKGRGIDFRLEGCTVSGVYEIYWKVKNSGLEATGAGHPRGEVIKGSSNSYEHTNYVGSHYVEIYVVQNNVCVAKDRQQVIVPPKMTW